MRVLVRMPDHLGDGVQALPALAALCAAHEVTAVGPSWVAVLSRGLACATAPEVTAAGEPGAFDAACLFKPSFSAAWKARRIRRRVGVSWDARRLLLTDVVDRDPETTEARSTRASPACWGWRWPQAPPSP